MGVRKNQATLAAEEKARFVAAVLQLKAEGIYDRYVAMHRDAMNLPRMVAHRSPVFLPWHREFIRRFELELQRVDASVSIPYWDSSVDRTPAASLWRADFMGGDGEAGSQRVTTGPFAFYTGRWTITVGSAGDSGPALRRALGQGDPLPRPAEVNAVLARVPYDSAPWSDTSAGFRSALEETPHNIGHRWVGGSMLTATSPNDPVFFLHHANIDRLWSRWQDLHMGERFYLPTTGGALGLNANDPMLPWGGATTPASVISHRILGYSYDDDPVIIPDVPVPAEPELIVGAAPLTNVIARPGEVDVYRLVVPAAGGVYTVETQGTTDVVMALFGPNDRTIFIEENDDVGGQNRNARIVRQLTAGTYYVRVRHYQATATGNYSITARRREATPSPIPPGIPELRVNGVATAGMIEADAESDLYVFTADASRRYTIETAGNTDTVLTLLGPASPTRTIAQNDDISNSNYNSRIVANLLAGIYFVRVQHYSRNGRGSYRIAVTA